MKKKKTLSLHQSLLFPLFFQNPNPYFIPKTTQNTQFLPFDSLSNFFHALILLILSGFDKNFERKKSKFPTPLFAGNAVSHEKKIGIYSAQFSNFAH
jgi:hypothetical protein